jgi:hypothetical protein
MSLEELRAVGLGQSRGNPIPVPAPADVQAEPSPKAAKHGVIFVNFDAIELQQGFDDSHADVSAIFGGAFAAFGGDDSARVAVMDAVRTDWAQYDVTVVDSRPASGDYTMNVTSPTNPIGGGVLGIAPLDCDDAQTHNNITFAFHGAGDGFGPSVVATTIGQEVAHSYGLEHVDDPSDILNPFNAGGDPSFRDVCLPIVQGGMCAAQHERHCGSAVSQNSHLELLELFGSSIPDEMAPVAAITFPANGAELEVGADFTITAEVTDDNTVASVQLFDGDTALPADATAPYTWEVVDIPEGVYEFTVVATDQAANEATSELVTVYVGVEAPAEDDGEGDGTAGDGTGTDGGAAGQDGDDAGCGCVATGDREPSRHRSGGGPLLGVGSIAVLGWWRRRRDSR